MSSVEYSQTRGSSILHRTPWTPPVAVSAKGLEIVLQDGRKLIDGVGGAAVTAIGMGNEYVIKVIQEQVARLPFAYSMQVSSEPAEELAQFLVDTSKGAFHAAGFVSGGSEAMEATIKLARQYYFEINQPQRVNFIARELSFHGNTIGTLSLGYHAARRLPYVPLLNNSAFHHVSPAYALRYKNAGESDEAYVQRLANELEAKFQELGPETVIGFVAETVVGAATGVVHAPKGYFEAMKAICQKYGALFILDEVMSGMGRMGTLHGWESFGDGAQPDIQAVAKGLGGGYASIGAVLMNKRVADAIRNFGKVWKHGHTYQSNPLSCAASLAVQKVIQSENLLANARTRGHQLSARLRAKLTSPTSIARPYIAEIRGGGVFWGIEFEIDDATAAKLAKDGNRFAIVVQQTAFENGLIVLGMFGGIDGSKGEVILLAPPLNVTEAEVDKIVDIFVQSVEQVVKTL